MFGAEIELCLINFIPEKFSKQNMIFLSSVSIYNCPLIEAHRNSVCLHVTGLPMQGVFSFMWK